AAKGVEGTLNTDKKKQHEITREEYYAGGESVLSVSLKPLVDRIKKKVVKETPEPEVIEPMEGKLVFVKKKVETKDMGTQTDPDPEPEVIEPMEGKLVFVKKKVKTKDMGTQTDPDPEPEIIEPLEGKLVFVKKDDVVDGPLVKPEKPVKPQPQGGRYAVQEQVKMAQKLVSEMNQMKDIKGKLAK
ncbi:hypothetical protein LWS69_36040, partial [Bordetella hinzii]|nr:hypothetical protein [Bordetella hinzii]